MFTKFQIVTVNLNPTKGHEQTGIRPCIILSHNLIGKYLDLYLVAPLTSNLDNIPTGLVIKNYKNLGLTVQSKILFHQIRVIDSSRIESKIGEITDENLKKEIELKIKLTFDLK